MVLQGQTNNQIAPCILHLPSIEYSLQTPDSGLYPVGIPPASVSTLAGQIS